MGQAVFANSAAFSVAVDGTPLQLHPVSMGNPHCVVFVDQPSETLARRLGPLIERLSIFPDRTNVQFVRVIDHQTLEVQIWERGVGYTLSSGTSSCAAAAVSCRLGLIGPRVSVNMASGVIMIELDDDYHVLMQGPVCRVKLYSLDSECLAQAD